MGEYMENMAQNQIEAGLNEREELYNTIERQEAKIKELEKIVNDKLLGLSQQGIIENQENTINELKNTIERQEILIEKLKCCGNCNKCMYLEGYGYKCKEEEVSLFDIREIPEWCESWELREGE